MSIEKRHLAVDFGTQIAHGAVRGYAMGERGARNEDATDDDIAAMARIVQEAVEAGALGFSTSRTEGHRAIDGEPVPGDLRRRARVVRPRPGDGRGRAGGVRTGAGRGSRRGRRGGDARTRLDDPPRRGDAATCDFTMVQTQSAPDLWRRQLDLARRRGGQGHPGVRAVRGPPLRHAVRLPRLSRLRSPPDVPEAEGRVGARGTCDAARRSRCTGDDPGRSGPARASPCRSSTRCSR